MRDRKHWAALALAAGLLLTMAAPGGATGHIPETDRQDEGDERLLRQFADRDPSAELEALDAHRDRLLGEGLALRRHTRPGTQNLTVVGRGVRLAPLATTDVWAHGGFAYTGTFNSPCGGEPDAGVFVWRVTRPSDITKVAFIPSPVGSRSNDVKVAEMRSGNILVHSNEPCGGGPGGFEIYNVDNPSRPQWLASVRIDELNPISDALFGGITDVGVHNLFLFRQGRGDYVAAVAESAFDNFRIYDITDPTSPTLVSAWGAEELFDPGVGDLRDLNDPGQFDRVLNAALWLIDGFGASANRFLHDITIDSSGQRAYLSNWDAGLVLMNIRRPADPEVISVALDPTSEDGEVNSHSAWPSGDGKIVVEGEEDFSPFASQFTIDTGPAAGQYPAAEGAITTPIAGLPGQTMTGPTTYVGFGCEGSVFDPGPPFDLPMPLAGAAGEIALIQRGGCFFSEKINNAETAGYDGVVVFNDEARGDALVTMGGDPVNLPGVFVGHSTGLAIAGVGSAADLVIGDLGETVSAQAIPDGWSGLRIWDYSDPANPVLASTFNTVCSASPLDPSCDPAGTFSSHNIVVETRRGRTLAYVSWYWEGVLVIDVTDPYNPEEIARFSDDSAGFMAQNGGPQDVWGIYKEGGRPLIYASDRNGGLYVLRLEN